MTSLSRLRTDAREIFMAGVTSADPFAAVSNTIQLEENRLKVERRIYELSEFDRIFAAGCGKAAARMALAVKAQFGDRLAGGIVVVKYGHQLPIEKIRMIEAGHPIPDEAGSDGARQMIELARSLGERDLLFFLISGGGSALLPCPAEGLTLADKQQTTAALLKSGASIKEVNAVRKHISRLKGGQFARLAAPSQVISLILSDVVDDSLEAIASGPTAPDSSTYADCLRVIRRYRAGHEIPRAVIEILERGASGELPETPKASDPVFRRVHNVIVGSNRSALAGARRRAEALGYHTSVASAALEGESRIQAKSHVAHIKEVFRNKGSALRPTCLISGGETTVTVGGDGIGGRNQEFALAAAIEIDGLDGVVVLSAGTDGIDGPTDAAGGIVDGGTIARGKAKNLDAASSLARNDSYHFLRDTGDLLITGPTLTNVMDLQITLLA
jgi:hydroxypyruvate reductase